jgi:hypothetical protein
MIQKHPENDPANDSDRVDPGVEITVEQGVGDHRGGMMAERSADGSEDADDNRGATLNQPRSASCNTVLDDPGFVLKGIRGGFVEAGRALGEDGAEDASSMPLPGLELKNTENIGKNHMAAIALSKLAKPNPLPGTIIPKCVENAGGSSKKRSPTRVCYDVLLQNPVASSAIKSRKAGKNGALGCYSNVYPDK